MAFERAYAVQEKIAALLSEELSQNTLAPCSLFFGPKGSGKLTTALSLAFAITGEDEKSLSSSSVIYIPERNLTRLYNASCSLYSERGEREAFLFFKDTMRKILLQYHSCLAPLSKDKKAKARWGEKMEGDNSLFALSAALDELLSSSLSDEKIFKEIRCIVDAGFITQAKKTLGASIDEIRAIDLYLSSSADKKVVILENVETYSEGAKNALLKVLEEPYKGAHFILLSNNPGAISETILSRLRKISFSPIKRSVIENLINKTFSLPFQEGDIEEFFFLHSFPQEDISRFNSKRETLASALIEGRRLRKEEEEEIFFNLEKMDAFDRLYPYVLEKLSEALKEKKVALERAVLLSSILKEEERRSGVFNLSKRYSLDGALREAACL